MTIAHLIILAETAQYKYLSSSSLSSSSLLLLLKSHYEFSKKRKNTEGIKGLPNR